MRMIWFSVWFLWIQGSLAAQVTSEESIAPAKSSLARKTIGEVQGFEVVSGELRGIDLIDGSLYTYVDPLVQIEQATVWAFGTKGRPHAIICLSTLRERRYLEAHSFSESELQFRLFDNTWRPAAAWKPMELPNAEQPHAQAARRLSQLRRLAQRFGGVEYDRGTDLTTNLRVVSQPIYRYPNPTLKLDGAVFVLARDADPEAILVIETYTKADGTPAWQYMLGRMTGNDLTLTVDGKSFKPELGRGVTDSYFISRRQATEQEKSP